MPGVIVYLPRGRSFSVLMNKTTPDKTTPAPATLSGALVAERSDVDQDKAGNSRTARSSASHPAPDTDHDR